MPSTRGVLKQYADESVIQKQIEPGIYLEYYRIETKETIVDDLRKHMKSTLAISYCYKGEALYRNSENTSTHSIEQNRYLLLPILENGICTFPFGFYHGCSIFITPCDFTPVFRTDCERLGLNFEDLLEKFSMGYKKYSADVYQKQLWQNLFQIPKESDNIVYLLRILEILLTMNRKEISQETIRKENEVPEILEFLESHLDQTWTRKQLAEEFNCTPSTLNRRFLSAFGMPTCRVIRLIRMQVAATHLRDTNDSVTKISQMVGYSNPSKFSATFKDYYRVTPTVYRVQSQKEE